MDIRRRTTSGRTGTNKREIDGLSDLSRRPHTIKKENNTEVEETILEPRVTKRFGCNRIRFRLKRAIGYH